MAQMAPELDNAAAHWQLMNGFWGSMIAQTAADGKSACPMLPHTLDPLKLAAEVDGANSHDVGAFQPSSGMDQAFLAAAAAKRLPVKVRLPQTCGYPPVEDVSQDVLELKSLMPAPAASLDPSMPARKSE